jgi:dTMP kinase
MKKKLFIVIEGLSGSGKTTLSLLLAEKLNGYYIKPPGSPFDKIRSEIDQYVDNISRSLFYLSGISHVSSNIKREISNKHIISDKYIYTTLAFPRSNGIPIEIPPYLKILMPDFAFYLETEESIRLERISTRENKLLLRKENMSEREKKIELEFQKFNLIKIKNNDSIEDGLSQIMQHLKKHL